jgi:DNA-binding transcriptional LysR family regulator
MLVAVARDRRLPHEEHIALSQLADDDWVTAAHGTSYAAMTVGVCRSSGGFEPRVRHRANDLQLMLDLVANHACVALVPSLGEPERHPGVKVRPLADVNLNRTIFALWRASDAARPSTAAVLGALGVRTTASTRPELSVSARSKPDRGSR